MLRILDFFILLGSSKEGVVEVLLMLMLVVWMAHEGVVMAVKLLTIQLILVMTMILPLILLTVLPMVVVLLVVCLLLVVLLVVVLLVVVLRLMLLMGLNINWHLHFLNNRIGMRDLFFHDFFHRIRNLYFLYLNHWERSVDGK